MNREKLYKLFQIIPNPMKLLDLLFSEPLIEKGSTFETKAILVFYAIGIGFFYDQGANKRARNLLIKYHIGCTFLVWCFNAFYLSDLKVIDVRTVTLAIVPIIITTCKIFAITAGTHFVFGKLVKFFVDDDNNCSDLTTTTENSNQINVKKWVIVNLFNFLIGYTSVDILFDLENQTSTNGFTERPHLIKFFPVWCPFENRWAKRAASFIQDAIVFPEILIFFSTGLMVFVSIIQIHNKFAVLFSKLKLFSERTFERIEIFDKQVEEAMQISNERLRSSIIKGLDEGKKKTIEDFHRDFIRCVERYQQLQRVQLLLKKNIMDYFCTISYCFILSSMIGYGFIGTDAFWNMGREFEFIIKMMISFSASGIGWYMVCHVGDLFSRQNDLFADEVYAMPWYHFSPEQRKTVLTVLSVIQQPTYLRALKLVIVKKDAFPDFLNTVYSYVQTMRTLQSVKHRNT